MKSIRQMASRFYDAVGQCPSAGSGVHAWMMRCANLAAIANVPPAEAETAINQGMSRVPNPTNEVVTAIQKAYAEIIPGHVGAWQSSQPKPSPRKLPGTARAFIHKGDGAGENDWLAASPVRFNHDPGPHQALALLDALYTPEDFLFCGEKYGADVLAVWRLRGQIADGGPVPPHIIPNPMTGRPGRKKDGGLSYRCDNSVEAFRFAVAEIDEGLTRAEQLALWWGFASAPIAALIDSGGKSIHAWLKVDRPDRVSWERDVEQTLFDRVLIPLGCDRQCRNESRLSRMPGHYRSEKEAWQRLLYLNPEAVR